MDDINFDELDKAVNSALQQTPPKQTSAQEEPGVAVSDVPVEESAAPEPVQKISIPRAPARSRGQFMDMVHPSSDMIKPSQSIRPSRQAATLQPLNPSIVETSEPDETSPSEHKAEEAPHEIPEAAEPMHRSEWPDPLDVMEQTAHEKFDDVPQALNESTTLISEVSDDSDGQSDENSPEESDNPAQAASTSPFINGAGPEKRPLGAFADASVPSGAEEATVDNHRESVAVEADSAEEPAAKNHDMPEELPVVPVPHELAPDVVLVESDDAMPSSEQPEDEPLEDVPASTEIGGMTASISPQYKSTEASSEEQDSHPVFDTKEYHQPLTPPAKRGHTGAIVTLTLILLALLGAGAWYAVAVLKLI